MTKKDQLKVVKIVNEHTMNCNRGYCDICHMLEINNIEINDVGDPDNWPMILVSKEKSKWADYGI